MELVTSGPVVSSVSRFSTNRILQLKQLLEFVSSKDQFKSRYVHCRILWVIIVDVDVNGRETLKNLPS